jgi:hypothetical protein
MADGLVTPLDGSSAMTMPGSNSTSMNRENPVLAVSMDTTGLLSFLNTMDYSSYENYKKYNNCSFLCRYIEEGGLE